MSWLLLTMLACKPDPQDTVDTQPAEPSPLTAWVVRHAEVEEEGGSDPHLSAGGTARAEGLAEELASQPVVAVFSTDYNRTRETAQPTATANGLSLDTSHDPLTTELPEHIIAQHPEDLVLVVGHSNTVPTILEALGMAEPPEIEEDEFGDLWVLTRTAEGEVSVEQRRYGEP